jgi:hypothetical protein
VTGLDAELDELATQTGFSGVVRIDDGDGVRIEKAWGLAHRGWGIPNQLDTRFGSPAGRRA